MKCKFSHTLISAILTVVPDNCINIYDELHFYGNDIKTLERHKKILGLGTRHIIKEGTTNNDLCEAAANKLIQKKNLNKDDIDTLIVVSTSHDFTYPASACILQGRLGLSEDCACFDTSGLACSAYVYGLWMAHSLVESGCAKKCLLLVGDIASTHSDKRNRNSNMLFGDAACATLVEYTPEVMLSYFMLGTRGKDWNKLVAPAGGSYLPIRSDITGIEVSDSAGNVWHLWDELMQGMDIFKFTNEIAPKGIEDILQFAGKSKDGIDYFAFHQANKQIVSSVARYAKLPVEKFSAEPFSKYGNCASAAVAVAICDQLHETRFANVLLATFGVGLSWGFSIVDLSQTDNFGVDFYESPANPVSREEKIKYWIDIFRGDINASEK